MRQTIAQLSVFYEGHGACLARLIRQLGRLSQRIARRTSWRAHLVSLTSAFLTNPYQVCASTYYVDAGSGLDSASGSYRSAAWKTIQKACEQVQPGDTVFIEPGVYFEHVQLSQTGTADRPITFRAADASENAVVISGADPLVRNGEVQWRLVDSSLGLYAIEGDHDPVRVLSDQVDLFPYESLQELKDFRLRNGTPGPSHGYFFDQPSSTLYLRLNPSGLYGSSDPRRHVMKVAPVKGIGSEGRFVHQPSDYNFGILAKGSPANVILEGFTFEMPGVDGVYSTTGNFIVRKCWFHGCRWAVSGRSDEWDPARRSNDVTVEYCDWGNFPTFDDALEVVNTAQKMSAEDKAKLPRFYWWERKENVQNTYETGMIARVGDRWTVRHNFIHDTVDGIASWGCDTSRDCDIYENCFYQLIDNAVEGKNHNQRMQIHDNYVLDTFEPFAWQPMAGLPWPGPMWIYRNVVEDTKKGHTYFDQLDWQRGCFKLLAPKDNWQAKGMEQVDRNHIQIPAPGFVAYNNTINIHGVLFTLGSPQQTFENVKIFNNVLIARSIMGRSASEFAVSKFVFAGNAVQLSEPEGPSAVALCEGPKEVSLPGESRPARLTGGRTMVSRATEVEATDASDDPGGPHPQPRIGAFRKPNEYSPPLVGPRAVREPEGHHAGT